MGRPGAVQGGVMDDFRNGHLNWDGWSFDYLVSSTEGLSLLNGYYAGRKVWKKLCMPVIRVKYVKDGTGIPYNPFPDGCGPYADHIQWITSEGLWARATDISGYPHHLIRQGRCADNYVGITEFEMESDGVTARWLELGIYARIGEYHIYQGYYLTERMCCPRVFSRGLACNLEHVHHAYWRFDLDVDGDDAQRAMVVRGDDFAGYFDLEGAYKMDEADLDRTRWAIENKRTGSRVWIFPDDVNPKEDPKERGKCDAFSVQDANVRLYRASEDREWPFHTSEMQWEPQDNPEGGDIVFWFVSHLKHIPERGDGDPWHPTGPTLLLEQVVSDAPQPATSFREITVEVEMEIVHSAALSDDAKRTFNYQGTVRLDREHYHGELAFRSDPVGDTTRASISIAFEWNTDGSIGVDYTATILLHANPADHEIHHLNVLREGSAEVNVHLRSGGLLPDQARVKLALANRQQAR
jgi:hypothetical protein